MQLNVETVYSHFINSYFVNSHFVNFPVRQFPSGQLPTLSTLTKWELTKWEVDKVGRYLRTPDWMVSSFLLQCWSVFKQNVMKQLSICLHSKALSCPSITAGFRSFQFCLKHEKRLTIDRYMVGITYNLCSLYNNFHLYSILYGCVFNSYTHLNQPILFCSVLYYLSHCQLLPCHLPTSHFVNIDQMGIDKVGIDKVGRYTHSKPISESNLSRHLVAYS